jgi:hypothetical protein
MKHRKNSHLPHWCCAIGIAFWGCHRSTPQRVTAVSIAAADQGAVVVVEGDAPRAFAIDAIDASGAQRWRTWLDLLGTHEASDHSLDPGSVGAQQLWIPSDDGDIGFKAVGRDLAPPTAQMPSITRK